MYQVFYIITLCICLLLEYISKLFWILYIIFEGVADKIFYWNEKKNDEHIIKGELPWLNSGVCPKCGASSGEYLDFTNPDTKVKHDGAGNWKVTVIGFCDNCGGTITLHFGLKKVEYEYNS